MIVIQCEQGSDLWKSHRLGKVTTSRLGDACATTKTGRGASSLAYEAELVCERFTKTPYPHYVNDSMAWGTAQQDNALSLYQLRYGVSCDLVGLVCHQTIKDFLSSPDAICGDGLVEVKCPNTHTMLEQLLKPDIIEKRYLLQCLGQLSCCENKQWVDLVYFDPRLPPSMQMLVRRIERQEHKKQIEELENQVQEFLKGVENSVSRLRTLYENGEANGQERNGSNLEKHSNKNECGARMETQVIV